MKVTRHAMLLLMCALASCSIGSRARPFDIRRDLSGLDVAYLEARAKDRHTENTQTIEGQLSGMPFWFLPAVSLRYDGNNALHRGEAIVAEDGLDKTPRAMVSGYQHSEGFAYGFGLLAYHNESARWDTDGVLDRYDDSYGFGWGLLYSNKEWGDDSGRRGVSAKILGGLLGYSEDARKGYLHLLWIPIPW